MPLIRCFGRGFRVPDLDQLFCYETTKLVNVLDWKPGVVYRAGIVFTCLYCFGFALIVNQMYLRHTQAFGSVMITAKGDAWSNPTLNTEQQTPSRRLLNQVPVPAPYLNDGAFNSAASRRILATKAPSAPPTAAVTTPTLPQIRYWDVHDTVNPDSESGGIVLATRVISTKGQEMKPCPNKMLNCPGQCKTELPISPGICYPRTTHCMEFNWCPLFGQAGDKSTEELIEGVDQFELDFMATMTFDVNQPKKVAVKHHTIQLFDLLKQADLTYSQIQSTGVVLYVKLQWGTASEPCGADADCDMALTVVKLKTDDGFHFQNSIYSRGNETLPKEYRDVSRTYGVRLIATSSGYATTFSVVDAVLQVASAFAMFALSYTIADIFVVFLNTRAAKYIEMKIEETPDLSDLKDKQEAAKIDAQTNKKGRRPRINRARQKRVDDEDSEDE